MGRLRRWNPKVLFHLPAGVLLLGLSWPASAQTPLPNEPGVWQPWTFQAIGVQARQVPAAEQRRFESSLRAIADVLRQLPFLVEPKGFNPRLTATLDSAAQGQPLGGILLFGAFSLYDPGPGRVLRPETKTQGNAWVNAETDHLMMYVNLFPDAYLTRYTKRSWKDAEGALVLELEKTGEVGGYPIWGDLLVVKNSPRELWIPAPAERVWKAVIAERKVLADGAQSMRLHAQQELDRFLQPDAMEQRQLAREKRMADAVTRGSDANRLRAVEEGAEKDRENELRARSNPDPAKGGPYGDAVNALAEAERSLAVLTVEQRQEPVCYRMAAELDPVHGRVVPPGTPGCKRVMQRNAAFFDANLPPYAVQVFIVERIQQCREEMKDPRRRNLVSDCAANLKLVDQMDWRKIAALLDR